MFLSHLFFVFKGIAVREGCEEAPSLRPAPSIPGDRTARRRTPNGTTGRKAQAGGSARPFGVNFLDNVYVCVVLGRNEVR